jgi:hypothetical protein
VNHSTTQILIPAPPDRQSDRFGVSEVRASDLVPMQTIDPFPIPLMLERLIDSPPAKRALRRLARHFKTDDWSTFLALRYFLYELEQAS